MKTKIEKIKVFKKILANNPDLFLRLTDREQAEYLDWVDKNNTNEKEVKS